MDEAFSFYYEDNLELLESYGAQILRFSPIHDSRLPDADGLLLGGGYPELWARELSANASMRDSIRRAAEAGMPILAECGGFQYLQKELETADGTTYEMAGALDGRSVMTGRLVRFGYVELSAREETASKDKDSDTWRKAPWLDPGQTIRGHEFHYSDSTCNGEAFTAVKPNGRKWDCMVAKGRILAGYPHLYYPSCPPLAERLTPPHWGQTKRRLVKVNLAPQSSQLQGRGVSSISSFAPSASVPSASRLKHPLKVSISTQESSPKPSLREATRPAGWSGCSALWERTLSQTSLSRPSAREASCTWQKAS